MKKLFGPTHYSESDLKEEGFMALGRNVRIAKNCTIVGAENITIGDNVRIDGNTTLVATGRGYIHLGSFIHLGGNCVLLGGNGIEIGDFSTLSWGVKIFSMSDDFSGTFMANPTIPPKFTGVTGGLVKLDKNVIIGPGSVILPDLHIKEGVAVGAISLIKSSIGPWEIYAGNPLKKIKVRSRKLKELEDDLLKGTSSSLSELNIP